MLCDVVQTSRKRSLLSKCHAVLRYRSNCNLTYDHKGSATFPLPIFTKLALTQYTVAPIDCDEFYPSRTKNVENRADFL